jgi:hypothetical protein
MSFRLGCVPIRQRREVSTETGVVRRIGAGDELSYLKTVQEASRLLLCGDASGQGQNGSACDRN